MFITAVCQNLDISQEDQATFSFQNLNWSNGNILKLAKQILEIFFRKILIFYVNFLYIEASSLYLNIQQITTRLRFLIYKAIALSNELIFFYNLIAFAILIFCTHLHLPSNQSATVDVLTVVPAIHLVKQEIAIILSQSFSQGNLSLYLLDKTIKTRKLTVAIQNLKISRTYQGFLVIRL